MLLLCQKRRNDMFSVRNDEDGVIRARDEAIAKSIVDGLKEQNISVSEAQDILYIAQDLIREKSSKQALSDMLKTMI